MVGCAMKELGRGAEKAAAVAFRERLILALLKTSQMSHTEIAKAADSSYHQVAFALKNLRKQRKARICQWVGRGALYEAGSEPDAVRPNQTPGDDVDLLPVIRHGATVAVFRDPLVAALFGAPA